MSSQNVELVRSLQPADADLVKMFVDDAPMPTGFTPDISKFADGFPVEFVSNLPGAERPTYHGLEGFVAGWRDWLEPYASYRARAEEFIDAGDRVVVLIRVRATTARDGVAVDHEPAAVWTIADGKVVALGLYLDRDAAFREAGLAADARPVEQPRR
jgi:ketosteroid isomerase-like protein